MKKGQVYFGAWLSFGDFIGGTWQPTTIEVEEWHVTHVDRRGIFLKQKTQFTWVRKSRTQGDYGWADSIDKWYTKHLPPASTPVANKLYKTKDKAKRALLPELRKRAGQMNGLITKISKL